ncbi:hypothetical protein [Oligoflexus tunisiensis]|uniref:hypothetical protein n=1 Tax=Oligoflexus tunisiensis TaxID=708132 RepID=UPI00114CA4BF|nr:hypothetical protein [Oligoflexus tunisiensis]
MDMTKKALAGLILLQSLVWSCGEKSPDSQYKPSPEPLDLGIWSLGSPLPQWYLKSGRYESGCLMEPSPFDEEPFNRPTYKKTRLIFEGTALSREITYFKDSGCVDPDHMHGQAATVSIAYRSAPDETGASYIVYDAYEKPRVSKVQVYLNTDDASFLNEHGICRKTWIPDSMNDVMELDQAGCEADVERFESGTAERMQGMFLLMRLDPIRLDSGFSLVARERPDGLGVKAGSGLLIKHPELLFTPVH